MASTGSTGLRRFSMHHRRKGRVFGDASRSSVVKQGGCRPASAHAGLRLEPVRRMTNSGAGKGLRNADVEKGTSGVVLRGCCRAGGGRVRLPSASASRGRCGPSARHHCACGGFLPCFARWATCIITLACAKVCGECQRLRADVVHQLAGFGELGPRSPTSAWYRQISTHSWSRLAGLAHLGAHGHSTPSAGFDGWVQHPTERGRARPALTDFAGCWPSAGQPLKAPPL